ncbi:hypothetical protein [Pseudarthrobacter siccitolerans]
MSTNRTIVEFRCSSSKELEEHLTTVVVAAERHAYSTRAGGVVVTRHDFNRFSVETSSAIPFGVTVEKDLVPDRRAGSGTAGQQ